MTKKHARPRVTHDAADLFAHFRAVAVYRAPETRRLALLKRAFFQAFHRIRLKLKALAAKTARPVQSAAVKIDHQDDCAALAS